MRDEEGPFRSVCSVLSVSFWERDTSMLGPLELGIGWWLYKSAACFWWTVFDFLPILSSLLFSKGPPFFVWLDFLALLLFKGIAILYSFTSTFFGEEFPPLLGMFG